MATFVLVCCGLAWMTPAGTAFAQHPMAQHPMAQRRPVPRISQLPTNTASDHQPKRDGWNLKWRPSRHAAAAQPRSTARAAHPTQEARPVSQIRQVSGTSRRSGVAPALHAANPPTSVTASAAAKVHPRLPGQPIRQARAIREALVPAEDPQTHAATATRRPGKRDYFADPFGDDRRIRRVAAQESVDDYPELLAPPPSADPGPSTEPNNALRDASPPPAGDRQPPALTEVEPDFDLPSEQPNELEMPQGDPMPERRDPESRLFDDVLRNRPERSGQPSPESPSDESIRGLLENDRSLDEGGGLDTGDLQPLPAPREGDDDGLFDRNPFPDFGNEDDDLDLDELRKQLDREDRAQRGEDADGRDSGAEGRSDSRVGYEDCDDFREIVARQKISDISLDPSPPFRPDVIDQQRYEKLRQEFTEAQKVRQWRSIDGVPLASGRLTDLAYGKAVIETEYGAKRELPVDRLSEADRAYVTDNWGLPQECALQQVAYQPRAWDPLSMTWKASNLCHKPLYFEEVNLERYGHTAGPWLQPVVSSAHFFANIAVLPYKMGVHSPHECQYALGYYRPGNCAPWIVPPVPLSPRGAISQVAVMTGGFLLIP